jgi:Rap1a immunity proteins
VFARPHRYSWKNGMRLTLVGCFASFLILPSPARALTASDLLASCELLERTWLIQPDGSIRFALNDGLRCWGYINAFFDMAYFRITYTDRPNDPPVHPIPTCPPKGVSLAQLVRMFLQYARMHPNELHYEAGMMMWTVLAQNFPFP